MPDMPNIYLIRGNKPGPKTIISGAIHGNEPLGVEIISALTKEVTAEDLSGELLLILGNPKAYKANQRFIDVDLNRLWSEEIIANIKNKSTADRNVEEQRILEIVAHIHKIDYLIDIHCTGKPTPYPFIYCKDTAKHRDLTQNFSVPYILSPFSLSATSTMNNCFDNYIDIQGGVGITLEAGYLAAEGLFDKTYEGVIRSLNHVGHLNHGIPNNSDQQIKAKHLCVFDEIIAQTDDFKFVSEVQNFSFFEKGATFAYDGNQAIKAPKDCMIIFPKLNIQKGKETCYLACSI